MATLKVKNVGPIREAEFEVKKHTVFIGPQGSGKSTLAKLIAICSDTDLLPVASPFNKANRVNLIANYGLEQYLNKSSSVLYQDSLYTVKFNDEFVFNITQAGHLLNKEALKKYSIDIWGFEEQKAWYDQGISNTPPFPEGLGPGGVSGSVFYEDFLTKSIIRRRSSYIPSERNLTAILSNVVWTLLHSDITLPKSITAFGRSLEEARFSLAKLDIQFLKVFYSREYGKDLVYYDSENSVELSQSASGYQSVIPLLLVIEDQRLKNHRRFIIEEPEISLYPTTQKDLIYSLMAGIQLDRIHFFETEWVITTHSPYVLSSFNTLMLAYKVAQKSDELRAEVEKIIPARCWINPDEFAAYYVDKGTVRSIMSEKTGLIADNELDDVSDDLGDEQDKLFALSRSVSRA